MVLEILRSIIGLVLVLFIPGFAILLVIYQKKPQLPIEERIVLSLALSMGLIPLTVYYSNVFFKIPITEINSFLTVAIITLVATFVWLRKKR